MADLIQEVDEALRAERMAQLWRNYKKYIIGAVVAIILGTALFSALSSWKSYQNREKTTELLAAFKAEDPLPDLNKIIESKKGHAFIAALNAANLELEKGNTEKAQILFDAIRKNTAAPRIFRDLATIQTVMFALDTAKETTATEQLEKLEPILADKKSPWAAQALLASALVKAHIGKDPKAAIDDLKEIEKQTNVPASITQRAKALKAVYLENTGDKQ